MRDVFDEFYLPDDDEVLAFVTEAVLVLDTNVLFDLYSLSNSERDRVLELLETVQERLWIPHQVGLEYQRNRMSVVRQRGGAYQTARSVHGLNDLESSSKRLGELDLPDDVRTAVQSSLDDLFLAIKQHVDTFTAAVDELADAHVVSPAKGLKDDPIRARLDVLLEGRVGAHPADRPSRVKEGVRRADTRIPPGFRDIGKPTDEQKAGDYLLWSELLDEAAQPMRADSRFLFITLDVKNDWFERSGGERIGPRPELRAEFRGRNMAGYHQLDWQQFLELANEHLGSDVDDETIARAGSTAQTMSISEYLAGTRPAWSSDIATVDGIRAVTQLDPGVLGTIRAMTAASPAVWPAWRNLGQASPGALSAVDHLGHIDPEVLQVATGIARYKRSLLEDIANARDPRPDQRSDGETESNQDDSE